MKGMDGGSRKMDNGEKKQIEKQAKTEAYLEISFMATVICFVMWLMKYVFNIEPIIKLSPEVELLGVTVIFGIIAIFSFYKYRKCRRN